MNCQRIIISPDWQRGIRKTTSLTSPAKLHIKSWKCWCVWKATDWEGGASTRLGGWGHGKIEELAVAGECLTDIVLVPPSHVWSHFQRQMFSSLEGVVAVKPIQRFGRVSWRYCQSCCCGKSGSDFWDSVHSTLWMDLWPSRCCCASCCTQLITPLGGGADTETVARTSAVTAFARCLKGKVLWKCDEWKHLHIANSFCWNIGNIGLN